MPWRSRAMAAIRSALRAHGLDLLLHLRGLFGAQIDRAHVLALAGQALQLQLGVAGSGRALLVLMPAAASTWSVCSRTSRGCARPPRRWPGSPARRPLRREPDPRATAPAPPRPPSVRGRRRQASARCRTYRQRCGARSFGGSGSSIRTARRWAISAGRVDRRSSSAATSPAFLQLRPRAFQALRPGARLGGDRFQPVARALRPAAGRPRPCAGHLGAGLGQLDAAAADLPRAEEKSAVRPGCGRARRCAARGFGQLAFGGIERASASAVRRVECAGSLAVELGLALAGVGRTAEKACDTPSRAARSAWPGPASPPWRRPARRWRWCRRPGRRPRVRSSPGPGDCAASAEPRRRWRRRRRG